jgi:hypothetical protein
MGAAALAAALSYPASAAVKAPTGSFTLSGDFREGATLIAAVQTKGISEQYEVTLGTWCSQPDGTQMRIGNHDNAYVYELTSVRGRWLKPQTLTLWVTGTGYSCTSRRVAVLWQSGNPVEAWTLDEQQFLVEV